MRAVETCWLCGKTYEEGGGSLSLEDSELGGSVDVFHICGGCLSALREELRLLRRRRTLGHGREKVYGPPES